jgi:folate-binding protein YgfZ
MLESTVAATDTTTLAAEYATLTERCGLVDRSERGKLALTGIGAVEFLNGQVTNELVGVKVGEGRYAAFLTHKGKMLGDLRILALGANPEEEPNELLLDTERSTLQGLFDMIRRFKVGYEVELHKRTLERSLLSLIGPTADAVVTGALALNPGDLPLQEHDHLLAARGQIAIRVIRAGTGFDLLFDPSAIDVIRTALVVAGAVEVSEAAAEIVRVEHGRPRYGIDLDESTIPQEADLNERAVSFTKGCYVGQETVARLYYRGKPNRHLRGLRFSEVAEPGAELHLGDRSVGHVGSSVISPTFGPIGLALVRREAQPGDELTVGEGAARAIVSELPFL